MDIKDRFQFEVSSWFEVFFALQVLTDDRTRVHAGWKNEARRRLPQSFFKKHRQIGGSPFVWPILGDELLNLPVTKPFEERLSLMAELPQEQFRRAFFLGVFHEPAVVKRLLSGRTDVARAVAEVSRTKREWLAFLGLYPAKREAPLLVALEFLLRTPQEFQRIVTDLLDIFWRREFKETWEKIGNQLLRSRAEKERLFQACTLEEFAKLALLRVEINERTGVMRAVRGGYNLRLENLNRAYVLPSAFNDKRHWTVHAPSPEQVTAFFPYFDPSISLDSSVSPDDLAQAEADPALIFKALGDATRYGIVSLLAREPSTSSDLAKKLKLSGPTISHHVHILREAGLVLERRENGAALLSINRPLLEDLSDLVVEKLFYSADKIDLKKTRTS